MTHSVAAAAVGAIVLVVIVGMGINAASPVTGGLPDGTPIVVGLATPLAFGQQTATNSARLSYGLVGYDGRTYSQENFPGRVVVLNFWNSRSAGSLADAANLQRIYSTWSPFGLKVLGIDEQDQAADAHAFVDHAVIKYPTGPDTGSTLAQTFGIRGVPATYILDQRGHIAQEITGSTDYHALSQMIDRLMANP